MFDSYFLSGLSGESALSNVEAADDLGKRADGRPHFCGLLFAHST
jgi:hypothetical protein